MMKTHKSRILGLLAALALSGAASSASATDFSFTGNLTNDNQVQLFNFTVGAASTVTLRTWSYAGGTNAAGTVIARGGFDPILALFDATTGAFIDQNDDGGSGKVAADSVTGQFYDTFLQTPLGPGNYTVSVMEYDNFAFGPNLSDGFPGVDINYLGFVDVTGNQRDSHWAFDILNVADASVVVGVPDGGSTLALLAIALVAFAANRRRIRVV